MFRMCRILSPVSEAWCGVRTSKDKDKIAPASASTRAISSSSTSATGHTSRGSRASAQSTVRMVGGASRQRRRPSPQTPPPGKAPPRRSARAAALSGSSSDVPTAQYLRRSRPDPAAGSRGRAARRWRPPSSRTNAAVRARQREGSKDGSRSSSGIRDPRSIRATIRDGPSAVSNPSPTHQRTRSALGRRLGEWRSVVALDAKRLRRPRRTRRTRRRRR